MTIGFQIYYCDYDGNIITYSNADGSAFDAPEWGAVGVVTGDQNHIWQLHQANYYCWYENENTWRGHDEQGLTDYQTNYPYQKKVLNGRYVDFEKYNEIIGQIYRDMPPKSAWYPWEPKPE